MLAHKGVGIGLVALLACCVSGDGLATSALTLHFESKPMANLAYQIDCMTFRAHCSAEAFDQHWRSRLGWNRDDDLKIKQWRDLFGKYRVLVAFASQRVKDDQDTHEPDGISYAQKLEIAALVASDTASYRGNLGFLMTPGDVEEAVRIARHFEPRFMSWWRQEGSTSSQEFSNAVAALSRSVELPIQLSRFAAFYEAQLPVSTPTYVHLILRPLAAHGGTFAHQTENRAVVEFLPAEPPENRLDVVAHELAHFFFDSAPPLKLRAQAKAFIALGDPDAQAVFMLLNETLATALGNGLIGERILSGKEFARRIRKEGGLFNDRAIDRSAKALMPVVARYISEGRTLFDSGFPAEFLATVRPALQGVAPSLHLRAMSLVFDEPFAQSARNLVRSVRASNVRSSSPIGHSRNRDHLEGRPELSGALLLSSAQFEGLKGWETVLGLQTIADLRQTAASSSAFVWAVPRRASFVFVFVAPNAPTMDLLIAKFAALVKPCSGLCLELP